ncbi:MAG: tRNA pseudouridine(55) synthase TruB [Balneolaceae bacterium]|nr:MAG: tRNA pseudouridine(55) synthase TruB [Balneolaceae bacterium]
MPRIAPDLSQFPCSTAEDPVTDPDLFTSGALILMDKPLHWSSFGVVKYVRHRVPPKKVGHAGTLDPLASGLLILCTGRATKVISQIQEMEKEYKAVVRFGASTPSYDAATEPDQFAEWEHITEAQIRELLENDFTGDIEQVPPMFSALKVKGKRLYEIARKGGVVKLEPRKVVIHAIDIDDLSLPEISLTIRCGKGTYIRSLAHDLGLKLGSRARLVSLRRTKTGSYDVENAVTPEQFEDIMSKKNSDRNDLAG